MRLNRFLFPLLLAITVFVSNDSFAQRSRFFFSTVQTQSQFDSSYQAVLTYASGQGYTLPSASQRILQNQLVLDLKAAGIWGQLDVFYVFSTNGDSDFATLNWKDPSTFQCSKVNSPTFTTSQGFTGNGSTSYLNTNWTANTDGVNYTLNDASFGIYTTTTGSTSDDRSIGANRAGGADANQLTHRNSSDQIFIWCNETAGQLCPSITDGSGLWHVQRTASDLRKVYQNGALKRAGAHTSTGMPPVPMFILGRNDNGDLKDPAPVQVSMAFMGSSLTDLQTGFYTAWNTYFTSL